MLPDHPDMASALEQEIRKEVSMDSYILYLNPAFFWEAIYAFRSSHFIIMIPAYSTSGLYTKYNVGVVFTSSEYSHLGKSNSNKVFDKYVHGTI